MVYKESIVHKINTLKSRLQSIRRILEGNVNGTLEQTLSLHNQAYDLVEEIERLIELER